MAELGFSEVVRLDDDRPLRQGHIFEWLAVEPPWRRYGLIVTADCDIAQIKHAGVLSYVPLVPLREYLALYTLPNKLRRAIGPLRQEVFGLMRGWQAENKLEAPTPLSEEAMMDWLGTTPGREILKSLEAPPGSKSERFLTIAEVTSDIDAVMSDGDFDAQFEMLLQMRQLSGAAKSAKRSPEEAIWTELMSAVSSLPGDAFFLSSVTGDARESDGFVAYLRIIRETNEAEIAIRASSLRAPEVRARRLAHLSSPYLYALTQQLAAVFSSIGLPTEYERQRELTVRSIQLGQARDREQGVSNA